MLKERSETILDEIEKRKVVPIPRWHFLFRQAGFWLLATFSVLTGSISMATAIYVFIDNDFITDKDYINWTCNIKMDTLRSHSYWLLFIT